MTIVCGRRFGKTELVLNKFIKDSWETPGDYVYIAPKRNQAKRIAWRKLKKFFPKYLRAEGKWKDESELWIENNRGGRIILLGADDPDSLRGEGWRGAALDEYADMDPYTFEVILASVGESKGYCIFLGTPKGYNHFYESFIRDPEFNDPHYRTLDGEKVLPDPDYKSFQFKTADNPHFPPEEIERARRKLTEEMFRQEFEASFENFTGLVYKEFMQLQKELILKTVYDSTGKIIGCIRDGKKVIFKKHWATYLGLDTGRNTSAPLKLMDDDGREYNFNMTYDVDGLVEDISSSIKDQMIGRNVVGKVIDSASQVKKEYQKHGIYCTDSKKDILNSVQMTRKKMKERKWFILDHEGMRPFINELTNRKWSDKPKGKERKVAIEKGNDHCCNAEDYIQNTFLHYPVEIETPGQKSYKKSLDYMVKSKPANNWKDRG